MSIGSKRSRQSVTAPDFTEARQHLEEMERLDKKAADQETHINLVNYRVAKLRKESERVAASKEPLEAAQKIKRASIKELLSGARSVLEPAKPIDVERIIRHNAEVDNEVAQIAQDIEVLSEDAELRSEQLAKTKKDHRQAEENLYVALKKALFGAYRDYSNALVRDCLLPAQAVSSAIRTRKFGLPGALGQIGGDTNISWWEDNKRVRAWPCGSQMTVAGDPTDQNQVLDKLFNLVRNYRNGKV